MGSMSGGGSKTKPLTPAQVQGYYGQLNTNTGGRLADFARTGTQPTAYQGAGAAGQVTPAAATYNPLDFGSVLTRPALPAPALAGAPREVAYNALSPERVQALGGLGALREQQARRASGQTLAQYAADPGLSTFQKFRADQLERQDLGGTLDALAGEREAAITQFLAGQQDQALRADLANQAAVNQGSQFDAATQNEAAARAAQLGLDYEQLLGGLTSTEQGRLLQTTLANQDAQNQAGQFNATTALTEAQRKYLADAANAGLSREDLQALANIFFGGMGNTSTTKDTGIFSNMSIAI